MGKTYTILGNKLNIKVLNDDLVKGKTWPGNRTNLNKGLLKNKKIGI